MTKDLDFDGLHIPSKNRDLEEQALGLGRIEEINKPKNDESDELEDASNRIFGNIGKTFLKGQVLLKGLRNMDPAQFIPISEDAEQASISAIRIDTDSSKKGTVVPFALYTKCIDILTDAQWQIRRVYEDQNIPPDRESHSKYTVKEYKNKGGIGNFIQQFFNGDGVAGALLTALSIAPFQLPGFSLLTYEEGSKAYFVAQVPPAIALLLELGIKAYRLKEFLKAQGRLTGDIGSIIDNLEDNPKARREALAEIGLDYDNFKATSEIDDCNTIVDYCNQYIAAQPTDGPKTYDHWIAYGCVSARQNLVRSAFDTATLYSPEFAKEVGVNTPNRDVSDGMISAAYGIKPTTKINNVIASHYNDLDTTTNDIYNDILNSFLYQVSDSDMCCLVEVFGSLDPEILGLLATILRLAATDLNGELSRLQDAFFRQLNNLSAAAIYQIIEKLRKIEDKFAIKFLKSLEDLVPHYRYCPSLKNISFAIGMSLDSLRRQIENLLMDILASIDRLGHPSTLSWRVPADRRFLLTVAKILDTLAIKIGAAEVCARKDIDQKKYDIAIAEAKDQAAYEITHTLLTEGSPASIQVTDAEIAKYFPDLKPTKSKYLNTDIGPKSHRENDSNSKSSEKCSGSMTKETAAMLKEELLKSIEKNFK